MVSTGGQLRQGHTALWTLLTGLQREQLMSTPLAARMHAVFPFLFFPPCMRHLPVVS